MSGDALPGPRGVANLRWGVRLARDLYAGLPALHATFGEVVELGLGRYRAVYLFGAEATTDLFAQGPATVSWHDAMAPLVPVDGETAIVVSDGADHARRRGVVQPAFGRRKLDDTIGLMADEARRTFAAWEPGTDHDASAELRACVRRIVVRALFGDELGAEAGRLGDHLEGALAYVNRAPWRRFDHDWPSTPYRRAMRARAAADRIVYGEIERRRGQADLGDRVDLLSALLAAEAEAALTDVEVRDQVVSLVAAGYETTSAAAAWLVHFLAVHDDARSRLVEEVGAVVGGEPASAEHLARMPWLNGVVSESLRLGSPAVLAGRRIEAPFAVQGHELPAGPFVFYCPFVTHRMERHWPDAAAFRPGRWVDGHADRHPIVNGAWSPFGGGARRCLGFAFAVTELKVLAVELIRATRGELVPERTAIAPAGLASMAPSGGVRVRVGPANGG